MFATAHSTDSLSADFHNELYPEAKKLLDWENPFPPPGAAIWYGHNLIWPPVAAFLVAPLHDLLARRRGLGDRARRARLLHGLAADRRRPRLARLRRLRAVAAGDRRDPRLAPHAASSVCCSRSSWRYRDASSRPGSRSASPARSSSSSGRVAIWLAAIGRVREVARRRRRRRRVAPARAPVHEPPRLLPRARPSSGGRSIRTATRRSAS